MKYILIAMLLSVSFISCKNEKIDTDSTNLSPIWEKDYKVGLTTGINPVLVGDKVVFSAYERENKDLTASSRLLAYDQEEGHLTWEWKNNETTRSEDIGLFTPVYASNTNLYFSRGPRCYSINSVNGVTNWFRSYGDFGNTSLNENNNNIYYSIGSDFSYKGALMEINLQTGDSTHVLEFNSNDSITTSGSNFIVEDNFLYYIEGHRIESANETAFEVSLIKYDRNAQEAIYEIPVSDLNLENNVGILKKYDAHTLLAISNRQLVSINEATAALNWTVKLPMNQFYDQILTTDSGLLYVVTEYNLMCVDINSGSVMWDVVPTHLGLNSRMVIHKGILYFVSGSRFNAFDAANGNELMSLEAPSLKWSGLSDGFNSVITLDAENDRIYTTSFTAAYCYPTLNLADL
jgi:hypothetical protein